MPYDWVALGCVQRPQHKASSLLPSPSCPSASILPYGVRSLHLSIHRTANPTPPPALTQGRIHRGERDETRKAEKPRSAAKFCPPAGQAFSPCLLFVTLPPNAQTQSFTHVHAHGTSKKINKARESSTKTAASCNLLSHYFRLPTRLTHPFLSSPPNTYLNNQQGSHKQRESQRESELRGSANAAAEAFYFPAFRRPAPSPSPARLSSLLRVFTMQQRHVITR